MIVRLKGVKPVRAKGRIYYYHRRTMTRLPGRPGSPEFLAALDKLNTKVALPAALPGTIGGLVAAYRASPEFTRLAPASRKNYDEAFNVLAPNAGRLLVTITPQSLYELRDMLAAERGWAMVNLVLTVLGIAFAWGIKRGQMRGPNPATGVDKLRRPHDARRVNRPWTSEELAAVLAAAGPKLRLALTLAAYTGLRSSDVVRVTWACYNGAAFETRTQKTGQRVWIPAHSRLRELLDETPQLSDTIVPSLTSGTLRRMFYQVVGKLRQEGVIGEGLSLHGLRHMLGHKLAEAGCDPPTIAAVLGHSTTRMAEHYSRTANRDHLAAAAFAKMEVESGKPHRGKRKTEHLSY